MQAYKLLSGVTRFQISVRERDGVVADLPSAVLRENFPVFHQAVAWFPELPPETFLPCLAFARLSVELPGPALRATAWLAFNDLRHAIEDAEAYYEQSDLVLPNERIAAAMGLFERRVINYIAACEATLRVMPAGETQPLEAALALAGHIRMRVTGLEPASDLTHLISQVLRERDRLPVPSVLPTLDPRTLHEIERADGVDR